jgi:hypothetical protein
MRTFVGAAHRSETIRQPMPSCRTMHIKTLAACLRPCSEFPVKSGRHISSDAAFRCRDGAVLLRRRRTTAVAISEQLGHAVQELDEHRVLHRRGLHAADPLDADLLPAPGARPVRPPHRETARAPLLAVHDPVSRGHDLRISSPSVCCSLNTRRCIMFEDQIGTYGLEDGVVELEQAIVERAGDAERRAGAEVAAPGVLQGQRRRAEPGAERGDVARGGGGGCRRERRGVVPLVLLLEELLVHDAKRAALHRHARAVPRAVRRRPEVQEGEGPRPPLRLGRGRLPVPRCRRHCCGLRACGDVGGGADYREQPLECWEKRSS